MPLSIYPNKNNSCNILNKYKGNIKISVYGDNKYSKNVTDEMKYKNCYVEFRYNENDIQCFSIYTLKNGCFQLDDELFLNYLYYFITRIKNGYYLISESNTNKFYDILLLMLLRGDLNHKLLFFKIDQIQYIAKLYSLELIYLLLICKRKNKSSKNYISILNNHQIAKEFNKLVQTWQKKNNKQHVVQKQLQDIDFFFKHVIFRMVSDEMQITSPFESGSILWSCFKFFHPFKPATSELQPTRPLKECRLFTQVIFFNPKLLDLQSLISLMQVNRQSMIDISNLKEYKFYYYNVPIYNIKNEFQRKLCDPQLLVNFYGQRLDYSFMPQINNGMSIHVGISKIAYSGLNHNSFNPHSGFNQFYSRKNTPVAHLESNSAYMYLNFIMPICKQGFVYSYHNNNTVLGLYETRDKDWSFFYNTFADFQKRLQILFKHLFFNYELDSQTRQVILLILKTCYGCNESLNINTTLDSYEILVNNNLIFETISINKNSRSCLFTSLPISLSFKQARYIQLLLNRNFKYTHFSYLTEKSLFFDSMYKMPMDLALHNMTPSGFYTINNLKEVLKMHWGWNLQNGDNYFKQNYNKIGNVWFTFTFPIFLDDYNLNFDDLIGLADDNLRLSIYIIHQNFWNNASNLSLNIIQKEYPQSTINKLICRTTSLLLMMSNLQEKFNLDLNWTHDDLFTIKDKIMYVSIRTKQNVCSWIVIKEIFTYFCYIEQLVKFKK